METYVQVRHFERVPVTLPVTGFALQFPGTALPGTVWYLSEGGMMVDFSVELMGGDLVRVFLPTFLQGLVEVEGKIVWTTAHGNVIRHGLTFLEPQGRDFIQRVLGENR